MIEIVEILCQEHRNIGKLVQVMEEELSVSNRGERPDFHYAALVGISGGLTRVDGAIN